MNTEKEIRLALKLQQAGDLRRAEILYGKILKKQPTNFDALHMVGVLYSQLGKHDLAIACIKRAILIKPTSYYAHYNLGNVFKERGQVDNAKACFRTSILLNPELAAPYFILGEIYQEEHEYDSAELHYRKALQLDPRLISAYHNLGDMFLKEGRITEAITYYQKALKFDPKLDVTYNNLGIALKENGRLEEAIANYQKALSLNPNSANAYQNLGSAYREIGKIEEAMAAFDMALVIKPDNIKARWAKCISQIPVMYNDKASIEISRSNYTHELLRLKDSILLDTPEDILAASEAVGSQQPYYLAYQGFNDLELQKIYGRLVHNIMTARYPQFSRASATPIWSEGEPLRVGVISGLFYRHTVWKLFRGWFENLDSGRFTLHGYYTGKLKDNMTEIARRHFSHFVEDIYGFEELCQIIKNDNLHVIIYPEIGMDPITVKLAALRLAPVQCVAWGHPETTGLPTIDYFLSSELMEPLDADNHYSEKLIRLPNISVYYKPVDILTEQINRDTFGLPQQSILYLSCQSLFKYLPLYDEVFPRITQSVTDCRFLFISHQSRYLTDQFHARIKNAFNQCGMNADEHVVFLPRLNMEQYFTINRLSDIYLDSIGWSGGNTTLEAIACNLPVLTLPGTLMRGRHSAGILNMMGVSETVASTLDEYVSLAVRLGQDSVYRKSISEKISLNKKRIYGDKTCVTALEDFFVRVVKERSNRWHDG